MKHSFAPKLIGSLVLLGLVGYVDSASAAQFVGDGRDDLVIGAPGENLGVGPRSGAAYLFRGHSYGVASTVVIDQSGLEINELGDEFGSAFAAGDFDGDGFDDLAIGAPGEAIGPGPMSGAVFVFTGTGGGLRASTLLGQANLGLNEWDDRFGQSLVAADFNGDGFDDLAVGAPGERYGIAAPAGAVYVFYGSKVGLLPIQIIDQTGLGANEAGDMFGTALSAGDYDGDGWADLAVGAPGEEPGPEPKSGLVFLYSGSVAGLSPDMTIDQSDLSANEEGDMFGAALTTGDFNDDGYHDLAVGAPGESPGSDPKSGAVFIFRGSAKSLVARQFLSQSPLDHNDSGDMFGQALTSGDFNGDGRDDLAVGAPGENLDAAPDTGAVYIFRGDPTNFVPLQLVTQSGMGANETDDRFGSALATGNYLGDDRIDLAVGAPGESRGSDGPSGSVYLLRGISLGLTPAREISQSALGTNEYGDMFGAAICD